MRDKPTVSVIIPCYNGENFVGEAIESVLSQTYQDFEIIVADDGSMDKRRSVIGRYRIDDRVKFVQDEKNRGIPAARNTAIEKAGNQVYRLH